MTVRERHLRERIDALIDERDQARTLVTELRRLNALNSKRARRLRASRDMWRARYREERKHPWWRRRVAV